MFLLYIHYFLETVDPENFETQIESVVSGFQVSGFEFRVSGFEFVMDLTF